MILPAAVRLMAAVDATWPAAEMALRGGWLLRRGLGGGQRVSAASPLVDGEAEIALAETALSGWDQKPLFRVSGDEPLTDAALDAAGYRVHDPVTLYAAPVASLSTQEDETARIIRVSAPVALLGEIWAAGGIGSGRIAVMDRAAAPKIALMARIGDRPAGCAFVACDGRIAMIHAIEVLASHRRRGTGARLLHGAANWAAEQGAAWLTLAVTQANGPACALYDRLGMAPAGRYHYRVRPGCPG